MRYETRGTPPLPRRLFLRRLVLHATVSLLIALLSLLAGMAGYMYFEHLAWRDAFLNAAMLLGGMGPVAEMKSDAAKLFSSAYALFCGLVFIGIVAVTLAPVLHRILHRFHLDESDLKH